MPRQRTSKYGKDAVDVASQLADIATNVKKYGAKGDGITDDTVAIQNAFNSNTNKTIYFPDGTYLISATLNMNNDNSIQLSRHATIKATAPMTYMLNWNTVARTGTYNMSFKEFIKGGAFNANYQAQNIMVLSYFIGMTIDEVKFLNFTGTGLITRQSAPSNELIAQNLYFRNDSARIGSLAIDNTGRDNEFSNILIRDIHKGIQTFDSSFSQIHGWIGYASLLPDSYFIKSVDGFVQASQVYADTYQFPFISCFGSFMIASSKVYWNPDIYTTSTQTSYPTCVFKSDSNPETPTTYGSFVVTGTSVHCKLQNTTLTNRYLDANVFNNNYIRPQDSGTIDYTNFKYKADSVRGGYGANVDDITEAGSYSITTGATGLPSGAYAFGQLIVNISSNNHRTDNTQYKTQLYIPSDSSKTVYMRYWISSGWGSWFVLEGLATNEVGIRTFTPVIEGSTTAGTHAYTTQIGQYAKSGKRINFKIILKATIDSTLAGDLIITGLPYASNSGQTAVAIGYRNGFTDQVIFGSVASSGTKIDLWKISSASPPVTSTVWADGLRTKTVEIHISGTYLIP